MTSIGETTATTTAAASSSSSTGNQTSSVSVSAAKHLVGKDGMGQWGKKNLWYPCVVKQDNNDGTIKVQWYDDMKYTKRLPIEKFRAHMEDKIDEPAVDVPMNIFASIIGDGKDDNGDY